MSESKLVLADHSSLQDMSKKDILLLSTMAPQIDKSLANRNTQMKIIKYILRYRDRYIDTLSSPYILNNLRYNIYDEDIIFETSGIPRDVANKITKAIAPPSGTDKMSVEVTPFRVVLLMVMRFFLIQARKTKKKEDQEMLMYVEAYYAYHLYIRIWHKYFNNYPPTEATMRIVLEKMSYKDDLKRLGSVDKMIRSVIDTAIEYYGDRLVRGNDSDVIYIIQQLRTRYNNKMRHIRGIFYEVTMNNEVSLTNKNFDEDGNENENSQGMLSEIYSYANNAATTFFSSGIDMKNVNYCAKISGVSSKELRTVISIIQKDPKNIEGVRDFYEAVFYIYFKDGGKSKDIKSLVFIAKMDNTFKKGNSIDKNIIKIKTLLDKWLVQGSAVYRATNREATMNNFRRAVYMYFIKMAAK